MDGIQIFVGIETLVSPFLKNCDMSSTTQSKLWTSATVPALARSTANILLGTSAASWKPAGMADAPAGLGAMDPTPVLAGTGVCQAAWGLGEEGGQGGTEAKS